MLNRLKKREMIVHGLDITNVAEAITRDLPFGLWCADFKRQTITGYNKFCDLLNAPATLKLTEFARLIRSDYRDMIKFVFSDIRGKDDFEIAFPTNSRWVKMKITHYDDKNDKAYGYIIEYHREKIENDSVDNLMLLMHKQNTLIHEVFDKVYIDKYNDSLQDILCEIRKVLNADQTSVVEYNFVSKTISCTYDTVTEGIKSRLDTIKNQSIYSIDWISNEITKNKAVYIYDINELSGDKLLQTKALCTNNDQSVFIQPLTFRDNIIGFMVIDFVKRKYKENALETDWIRAMSRFVEFCTNLKNKQRFQDSEKTRLRCVLDMAPFGHLHMRFEYDINNNPHDLSIIATNAQFEQMLNIENVKGKLISEVFGAEATHMLEKCVRVSQQAKKETIIDDFIYYNGASYAGGVTMSSDDEFVCVITNNPTLLYGNRKANSMSKTIISRELQHLLRTHLNAIVGFAELLSSDNNEQNKTKYMEIIKDNAQSLIDSSFIKDSLASPNEDKSGQPDDNNRSRKKILIAEDTESNYMLVSYILKSQYDIEWAHDGVEAIEMYEKSKPDLILMDVRMPRLGGLSATSRIRETDKETPIIALTAFAFENDRAKTLEAGCTNFLAKPIKAAALKEMVAKYIGE